MGRSFVGVSPDSNPRERRRYPMQKQPEGKVSLSQLLKQAQERVREEVLGLLKETFEGLLEALRDEVVGRGRYERSGSGGFTATYLLSQREKTRVGRDTPYQLQWNFNISESVCPVKSSHPLPP